MIISKENNAFVISGIFDGTLRNGKVCFPMNTTSLIIDGRDIVRFIDAVSQDELFATPLRTLAYDGEIVTRETLFEDFDAVATAAGSGPGPAPEPEMDWFTITNLTATDSSVLIGKQGNVNNISLKVSNDGVNWTEYNDISTDLTLALPANGYLKFNGRSNDHWSTNDNNYWKFHVYTRFKVSGNLNTLLADLFSGNGVFTQLFFNESNLVDASELVLPWNSLANNCYYKMFSGCSSLNAAPTLPATTLASNCYAHMFEWCSSLTTAPVLPATKLADSCYSYMFYDCTSLTTAPTLPATTLANNCYAYMFQYCTSLTTAPALPATNFNYYYSCYTHMFEYCTSLTTAPALPVTNRLESNCYASMFKGCTSLTTAPELPATTLAQNCYASMFQDCTSLTTAPALPVLTLYHSCYSSMFKGCTSLTTAPTLPATTLQPSCYSSMFNGCSSLTTAPELPANEIKQYSYNSMFNNCTSLNYVKCLATVISTSNTDNWLKNVSATGTFECAGGMSQTWTTGTSGIPTGWTVVDPSVAPVNYFKINNLDNTDGYINIINVSSGTSFEYSTDDTVWTLENVDTNTNITLPANGHVSFRNGNWRSTGDRDTGMKFNVTGINQYSVSGDISTLCENDPNAPLLTGLFKGQVGLVDASALVLSYDTVGTGGYGSMFEGCSNLQYGADVLATTTTGDFACARMYYGCTSLTTAPVLAPTTLGRGTYGGTFQYCTSLVNGPELPATNLPQIAYEWMFYGCQVLEHVRVLATTGIDTAGGFGTWMGGDAGLYAANTPVLECECGTTALWRNYGALPGNWLIQKLPTCPEPINVSVNIQYFGPDYFAFYDDQGNNIFDEDGIPVSIFFDSGTSPQYGDVSTAMIDSSWVGQTIIIEYTTGSGRVQRLTTTVVDGMVIQENSNWQCYSDSYGCSPCDDPECNCLAQGGVWDGTACLPPEPEPEPEDPCMIDPICDCETNQGGTWDYENNICLFD